MGIWDLALGVLRPRALYLVVVLVAFGFVPQSDADWSDEPDPALSTVLNSYIYEVEKAVQAEYPEWIETLMARDPSGKFQGFRLHYLPNVKFKGLKLREFLWALIPGTKLVPPWRPSLMHLETVRRISAEVREELQLTSEVGYRSHLWVEEKFLAFESTILASLDSHLSDLTNAVEGAHDNRAAPSSFETERLFKTYLDAWVLAALLSIETDRFLENFDHSHVHLSSADERQDGSLMWLSECRTALLRMADPNYRW